MKPYRLWLCKTLTGLCFFVGAIHLPTAALSVTTAHANDQVQWLSRNPLQLAQQGDCSQRFGPYATQTTAWQRWREAKSQGNAVSNGVVPCYDNGYGYCFY